MLHPVVMTTCQNNNHPNSEHDPEGRDPMLDVQTQHMKVAKKPIEKPIKHRGLSLSREVRFAPLICVSIS
jgi:hypothetical protein